MFLLLFPECWYCGYGQPPSSMQSWGSTSGPHICKTNILPTEPHPQLQMLIFEHILWIFYPPMAYNLIWCYVIYCVLEARSICMCGHQRSATKSQFLPATWLTQGSSHFWCCVVHSWLAVLWPSRQSSCLWHSSHYKGLRVQVHELLSSQPTFYKSLGIKFSYQPGQQVILLTEPSPHLYSAF